MTISVQQKQSVLVFGYPGEALDASNATEFKNALGKFVHPAAQLVFDMSAVRFVDSSGLGAMLSCLRKLHGMGGDLKLCAMNKPVRALFELVRMHRVFEIFATEDEAVRSYEPAVA